MNGTEAHEQAVLPQVERLTEDLGAIELGVLTEGYTLADAIREGSQVSAQAHNWGDGDSACALTAAFVAAKSRGYVE